jgi:hypothetical protein
MLFFEVVHFKRLYLNIPEYQKWLCSDIESDKLKKNIQGF